MKSTESSSLNDSSANATELSSLKSSTSSGIHTIPSETSSLNNSSSSGVSSQKSAISTNSNSARFSALGRSLNQAGDKYEQSYTPTYQTDFRNHPLTTARIPAGVTILGNLFKTMMLGPHSADSDNTDKFRPFPIANNISRVQDMDSLSPTTKKSSNTATPDVQLAEYYRVQNLAVCNNAITDVQSILPNNLLQQPSTVFVYSPNVSCVMNRMSNRKLKTYGGSVLSDKFVVVTASIHKMYSMKEKAETSSTKTRSNRDNTPNEDFKDSGKMFKYCLVLYCTWAFFLTLLT